MTDQRATFTLEAHDLRKSFGGVEVLHGVNVKIEGGKVLAVVGENGAGKSTMIKIISGVYQPDSGLIELDGKRVVIHNPRDGQSHGIRVIYQEMTNAPTLTVYENIFLGHLPNGMGVVNRAEAKKRTYDVLSRLDVDLNPNSRLSDLSVADHQVVEIARALVSDARMLIFDEPTSALSPNEVENLFSFIRRLRDEGVAIVYITHRLNEVPEIADDIVIIRDGNVVAQGPVPEFGRDRIVEAMTGEKLQSFDQMETQPTRTMQGSDQIPLEVQSATLQPLFNDVSFHVQRGEIVSLFGRIGCGAMELGEALFGLHRLDAGQISIQGVNGQPTGPRAAKARGLGFVPVDRKTQGLLAGLSAGENLTVVAWGKLAKLFGILTRRAMDARYEVWRERLSIRGAGGSNQRIGTLSGGNQQKVVLGRWLENNSAVLVLAEPTRGVDVGARAEIYGVLESLADEGIAILVISTDAEEVLRISHRIVVLSDGKVSDQMLRTEASLARLASSAAAAPAQ